MSGFEGSFLGNNARIAPDSTLECGVCWWVYDPAKGDETWQIPAGTPFTELPGHWRCPSCDAAREQFMVLRRNPAAQGPSEAATQPAEREMLREREQAIRQAYLRIDERMRQLPVYNRALDVQVLGLQRWQDGMVAIAVTPWCMNILLLAGEAAPRRIEGTTRDVEFPSGQYRFIAGELDGVGPVESCSLFSPMEQFDDPAVVSEVARHALRELLSEPPPAALSRRRFLRGGGGRARDHDQAGTG